MKFIVPLLLILIVHDSRAADTLNIRQAVANKRISVTVSGTGGIGDQSAQVNIQNNISTDLIITIPAGLMLYSTDPMAQDLLLLEDAILFVDGRGRAHLKLYGACTQSSNYCPKSGEKYRLGGMAPAELLAIANIINDNQLQSSIGQAAVWAFTDNHDLDNIFAENYVDQSWDIAKIITTYRNERPPSREQVATWYRPTPRVVFAARTDLMFHAPKEGMAELAIYDTTGQLVKRQFHLKPLHAGLHLYTVGLNNILDQETYYIVRLQDEGGNILTESRLINNQHYSEIKKKILKIDFEYIVRESAQISLGVYDAKGILVQSIFENKSMPLSKRRSHFSFYHAFDTGTALSVRITDQKNTLLHEEKLIAN